VGTASCAVATFVNDKSATNAIGNFFMGVCTVTVFKDCDLVYDVRDSGEAEFETAPLHKCEPRFRRSELTEVPRENAARLLC
jgi:hypothetical protein